MNYSDYTTYMEINLDNFKYNIERIREKVGNGITLMPVLKANAYGTYINTRIDILNEFEIVAVANVAEAVYLRSIGYKNRVFVLNQAYISEIDDIIKYDISVGSCQIDFLRALNEKLVNTGKKAHIHLEIETGMGRTGIFLNDLEKFIDQIGSNIEIDGIYTHFSSADDDFNYTNSQIEIFNNAIEIANKKLGNLKYIHASASNGILNFENARYNTIRPGIIMYGYSSSEDTSSKIDLKPVAKLKSKIVFLKDVTKGTSIGYNRSFITNHNSKIATVPIGYADGMKRELSNNFSVIVHGIKCPIVGKICMDSLMLDVTDVPNVSVGDEVIIWDNENIKLEDIASKCHTINYEVISTIGSRVKRVFI